MANELPTTAELVAIGTTAFRNSIDPDGTSAVNLASGSRNDAAISFLTALLNRMGIYVADRTAAARLASSTGEDLLEIGRDWYGEKPKAAVAATGEIRLTRGIASATSIPRGSRFGVPAGPGQRAVTFEATRDIPTGLTSVLVPIQCAETGSIGNIRTPEKITAILDTLPDTTWQLDTTHTAEVGGGAEEESEADFKARLFLTTPQAERQRGTKAAIDTGALRVPGARYVTSIEPLDGTVILYEGDNAFSLPDELKLAIDRELLNWRCFGVPVIGRKYNLQTVTVTATVYMARSLANYDQVAIAEQAVQRVKEYFEGRPQPDEYYREMIISAIGRVHPEIQHVVLAAPVSDVTRPSDSGYGVVSALNRYKVDESSVSITVMPPFTT